MALQVGCVVSSRSRQRVSARGFRLLDLGLDGAGGGVVAAVADEVADQDARGADHGEEGEEEWKVGILE
jgi:hypothetical protein